MTHDPGIRTRSPRRCAQTAPTSFRPASRPSSCQARSWHRLKQREIGIQDRKTIYTVYIYYIIYIYYIYILCYDTNTIYKYTNCNTLFQFSIYFNIYNHYLTITIIINSHVWAFLHFSAFHQARSAPISTVSTQVDHGFHSENLTTTTSTRATRDPGDDALSCTELRTWPGFMIPTALFFLEQKTYN